MTSSAAHRLALVASRHGRVHSLAIYCLLNFRGEGYEEREKPPAEARVTGETQKKTGSPGNDLLSRGPAPLVPSALEGLTAWFGMEQGVSPPLKSPEEPVFTWVILN